MTDYLILIPIMFSFLVTLFMMPLWIKKAKQLGLIWDDMNKTGAEKVAGSGGVGVIVGALIGIMIFIAYRTFYLKTNSSIIEILALLVVILASFAIGLMDDLFGWQHGGLSKTSRLILVFPVKSITGLTVRVKVLFKLAVIAATPFSEYEP